MNNPIREACKRLPGHWYKGGLGDNRGNLCGIGHLREVLFETDQYGDYWNETVNLMNSTAGELFPDRAVFEPGEYPSFAVFNDHKDTTEEEVLSVMEKAAIKLEEQV